MLSLPNSQCEKIGLNGSCETTSDYWFLNRKGAKAAKPFSNRNGRFEKTAISILVCKTLTGQL